MNRPSTFVRKDHPFLRLRLAFLLFAVLLAAAPPLAGAQALEASLEDLAQSSNAVVVGKTTSKRSFWSEDRSAIFTEVTVRVEQNVKGQAAEETVITIPGGQVGNMLYEVSDMPIFIEGEEVVVFLWNHPSGKQLVTGASQGKLAVMDDPRTGEKAVLGASRLLHPPALGKNGIVEESRRMPLKDFVDAVKRIEP